MSDWRTKRATWAGGLLVAAWLALGCAGPPTPPPEAGSVATYRVGPPDQLQVTVLPDPSVLNEVVVRPDGMITVDLIGDVPAQGRTLDQIAGDIEQRMSRYKRDAMATVRLVSAQTTAVTIFGEVKRPNAFPLLKETRVAEAIGLVGGETVFARTGKIRVIRSSGGEATVHYVNLNAIRAGDLRTNIVLASGDIVYVPANVFALIGYAMNSLLLPFQPFMGVANAALGSAIGGF